MIEPCALFVDDLCQALFGPGGPLGRLFETAIGLSHDTLDQIGVLLSGVLRLGLMLFGWAAIVAPFGASARDIFGRVTSPEVVFKLGQLSISPDQNEPRARVVKLRPTLTAEKN